MGRLASDFVHPVRVPVPGGYHLGSIAAADTDLDYPAVLDSLVPRWIAAEWPFSQPRYVGQDISWPAWPALPGR